MDRVVEAIVGNQAADHGVPEEDVGLRGLAEDVAGVSGVTEIEAGAEDQVEKIVVLVEAKAKEPGVGVFEVVEGGEALKEALLGF